MDKYVSDVVKLQDDPIWEHLETIEGECKDKAVYTSSKLTDFAGCSWYGKLKHIDKIPEETRNLGAVCGRGIHASIHRVHSEKLWKHAPDIFDEEWKKVMDEDVEKPWSGDVTDSKLNTAQTDFAVMFDNYCQRNNPTALDPKWVVHSEIPFRGIIKHPRTKTRYRLSGKLDQVRRTIGHINVTDVKSGKDMPNQHYLMRSKQFGIYGWATKNATFIEKDGEPRTFGRYPDSMTWYHLRHLLPYKKGGKASAFDGLPYKKGDLRGDPEIRVVRTEEDYDFLAEEVCRIIQIIRFGLFVRAEDSIRCSMCRLRHACTAQNVRSREDDIALADLDSFYALTKEEF